MMNAVWSVVHLLSRLVLYLKHLLHCGSNLVEHRERKCVLITGCDSGFGREAALLLDSQGIPVIAGCLTKQGAQYLNDNGTEQMKTLLLDVTKESDVTEAALFIKEFLQDKYCLWGLVNNAAVHGWVGLPLESLIPEDYLKCLNVNLLGAIRLTGALLPVITACGGRVVNVCCATSRLPVPGNPAYIVSKGATEAWSHCLRRELQGSGVKVVTVYPGGFKTRANEIESTWREVKKIWTRNKEQLEIKYGDSYIEHAMIAQNKSRGLMSSDVTRVAHVYMQALFSTSPCTTYSIGSDACFMSTLSYLPMFIQDWVIGKIYRNPRLHKHQHADDLKRFTSEIKVVFCKNSRARKASI